MIKNKKIFDIISQFFIWCNLEECFTCLYDKPNPFDKRCLLCFCDDYEEIDFKELLIKEYRFSNMRITKSSLEKILNKFNDYQEKDYSKPDEVHFNDCIYYKDLKHDCTGEISCLEHRIESFIKDFEKGKINFDGVD